MKQRFNQIQSENKSLKEKFTTLCNQFQEFVSEGDNDKATET